jgi:hypothetical protein
LKIVDLSGASVDAAASIEVHCVWCGRAFTPRTNGGSSQKFCCSGHRQAFWIAARRWTMRAIEAVDCLKASPPSVHAVRGAFQVEGEAGLRV